MSTGSILMLILNWQSSQRGMMSKRRVKLLRSCLYIKPDFKPAIKGAADTYRKSDPGIAEKYDKLLNSIN